jgi:hypothetical protein
MRSWTRYLLAFLVSVHGLIYIVTPLSSLSTTVYAGWKGSSVLLGSVIAGDALKSFTTALWLIAGVGIVLAGVSFILVSRFPSLWRPLTIFATAVGILSFVVFWDGQTAEFVNQGGIGLVLSAMILVGALGFSRYVAPTGGIHARG